MITSLQQALIQKDQEINFYKNQSGTKSSNLQMRHPLDIQSAEENVLDDFDDDIEEDGTYDQEDDDDQQNEEYFEREEFTGET